MIRTILAAAALSLAAPALAEDAPPPPAGEQVSIPFASRDIIEWKNDGARGLFIRANGKWYYAQTQADCRRMIPSIGLGFETSPGDQLDRYSAIHAQGWRCQLDSVTRSEGPPKKHRKG
ncbi:hypothetical protein FHS96_004243 [Sphingomonas zeicaulis]|uniref:DUF6491 family protein n=1 Tax=Sphingomonas zeicaulis TaxID=1632740 RepID=UPI003D2461BA